MTGYWKLQHNPLYQTLWNLCIFTSFSEKTPGWLVFHRFFLSVVYLPQKLKVVAGLKSLPVWNEKLKDLLFYMPNWLPVFAMFYIFASFKQIWITKYTGFVEVTIFTIEWQGRSKLESSRVKTTIRQVLGRLNYHWVDWIKPMGRVCFTQLQIRGLLFILVSIIKFSVISYNRVITITLKIVIKAGEVEPNW